MIILGNLRRPKPSEGTQKTNTSPRIAYMMETSAGKVSWKKSHPNFATPKVSTQFLDIFGTNGFHPV